MKEFTQVRNHSVALSAPTNAHNRKIWSFMKQSIQVIKPFTCSYCDFKTNWANSLKNHEKTHSGDKPFSCSQCDYKCITAGQLMTHKRTHTGVKPFSCSKCDYKCTSGHLKTHERIHTGDKPFTCSHCAYKCTTLSQLKVHERGHFGMKPFSCSQCAYNAQDQVIWRLMKEPILVINHSAAPSVTINAQH